MTVRWNKIYVRHTDGLLQYVEVVVRKTGCEVKAASARLSAADSDNRSRMESHGRSESSNMQF
jgi:hypothetical protein